MDLVIVGVEASLWTAEQFGQDLKVFKADLALACTAALRTALCPACLHAQKPRLACCMRQEGAHAKRVTVYFIWPCLAHLCTRPICSTL